MEIKTAEIANMLRDSAKTIRDLREKVADYEKSKRVDQIMAKMASKGIETELSEDDLRESLMKKAAEGKLDSYEEAVDLSSGLGTMKIASDDGDNGTYPSAVSGAALDSFIATGN